MRGKSAHALTAALLLMGSVAATPSDDKIREPEKPSAAPSIVTLYEGEIKDSKLKGIAGFKITYDSKTKKKQIDLGENCKYGVDQIGKKRGQTVIVTFKGEKIDCGLKLPGKIFGRLDLSKHDPAGVIQFHGGPNSKEHPVDLDVATAWKVQK